MTQKPTDTQFSVRICGITYEDVVTLCERQFASAAKNWCDDDGDDDSKGHGTIEIPVRHIDDLIELLAEIKNADDWAGIHCWDVSLHVNRMAPTYNIVGHLAESGASLVLMPCRPANKAVDEALSRMQLAIADARAAACLLEEPTQ